MKASWTPVLHSCNALLLQTLCDPANGSSNEILRKRNKLKRHHKFHGFAVAISFPTYLECLVNDCQSPNFGSPPSTTELGTPQISASPKQTLIGACAIFRLLRSDSRWNTQLGYAKA